MFGKNLLKAETQNYTVAYNNNDKGAASTALKAMIAAAETFDQIMSIISSICDAANKGKVADADVIMESAVDTVLTKDTINKNLKLRHYASFSNTIYGCKKALGKKYDAVYKKTTDKVAAQRTLENTPATP